MHAFSILLEKKLIICYNYIMVDFKFITHDNNDAYFNLASEEYLLKHTDGFYFYLWVNAPAVIVGVNQNAIEEVNLAYTESNGIKVVRRLTGGGAVYHDRGNLCYTVIAPYDENENNYIKFTAPVIKYLNSLGVKAEFSGRNDITVNGQKISGNAQTIYNGRIMHHGTILFSTDFSVLEKTLNPSKIKVESKGIKSVRARVTNVSEHLINPLSMVEFKKGLCNEFKKDLEEYDFTDKDLYEINKLVDEKYSRYEWNIARSPKGENRFTQKFSFGIFTLNFDVVHGLIENAEISGDFFELQPVNILAEKLNGLKFTKQDVAFALKDANKYIQNANGQEIADKMF